MLERDSHEALTQTAQLTLQLKRCGGAPGSPLGGQGRSEDEKTLLGRLKRALQEEASHREAERDVYNIRMMELERQNAEMWAVCSWIYFPCSTQRTRLSELHHHYHHPLCWWEVCFWELQRL